MKAKTPEQKKARNATSSLLARRKRERKRLQKQNPGRSTRWVGGILHFSDTNTQVPGARKLPKDGVAAIGLAAEPSSQWDRSYRERQQDNYFRRRDYYYYQY